MDTIPLFEAIIDFKRDDTVTTPMHTKYNVVHRDEFARAEGINNEPGMMVVVYFVKTRSNHSGVESAREENILWMDALSKNDNISEKIQIGISQLIQRRYQYVIQYLIQ